MKKGYLMVTLLLIFITVFCTTGTVMGMEKGKAGVDETYYRQAEKEYVQQVKRLLTEEGFENSGVALTKVLYENGSREYTLQVHHKHIGKLSRDGQEALQQMLIELADTAQSEGVGIEDLQVIFL